ncbi:MAG: phage tail protein [Candidatus Binataceae bacterium]|jgi:phage tail-like protein
MAQRTTPYPAFNFIVNIGTGEALGGFSEVSGLQTDIAIAEYRDGNDKLNYTHKIQGIYKANDVVLKRGVMKSADMWSWIQDTRTKGPDARREVSIVMRDEAGQPVQTWNLHNCLPKQYQGPHFEAKGAGEVAIEQLTLSVEALDLAS